MTALMSFTVGTNDLRRALKAVTPNACRDDELPMICRIRCYVDSENVTVAATDRFTAALGLVSVWDHDVAADGYIDLSLPDVGKILAVFTAGKDQGGAPQWQLRIELLQKRTVTDDDRPDTSSLTVRITDVSGMIDGEVLDLPALTPHDNFPNLLQLFANHLAKATGVLDMFGVSGELLARMKTAAKVYGDEPLVLSTPSAERSPILARCGDSFLGLVMPVTIDEDHAVAVKNQEEAWQRRLPAASKTLVVELDTIKRAHENDPEGWANTLRSATEMVVTVQFGSASMLQRRLGISWAKADRVLDDLEAADIVGPARGSMARTVRFPAADVQAALARLAEHQSTTTDEGDDDA